VRRIDNARARGGAAQSEQSSRLRASLPRETHRAAIVVRRRYFFLVRPNYPAVASIAWGNDGKSLRILDQTALPERETYLDLVDVGEIIDAILNLRIRGAPAIGVAAAMGLVVALDSASNGDGNLARELLPGFADRIGHTRPTAVNLGWAINRMRFAGTHASDEALLSALRVEAERIFDEDVSMCAAIGEAGFPLIANGARVLTHCNAGALATAGIGTALAPLYVANNHGYRIQVFADETRPLRQGARITAWELARANIEVTVLADSAAASLLRDGGIDLVIVGADRIAANGDVANKIGTYPLALAAHAHGVPFYVAAPWSTFDLATPTGASIPIEQRPASELGALPHDVRVYNPAFDVTPAALITAYITNIGLLPAPFTSATYTQRAPLNQGSA
jgi:methylthioribose-1-phosphate isomerase